MKKKKIAILAIIIMFLARSLVSGSPGGTGAQILRIEPTARSLAMGDAFTAMGDDINSLFYNPAGLNYILDRQVLFSHVATIDNFKDNSRLKAEYIAYAQPIGKIGAAGGYIYYSGTSDVTYEEVNLVPKEMGIYKISDFIFSVGYGRPLIYGIFAGANLKIVRERLADYAALGIAIDLGGLYTLPEGYGVLGVAIKNIGFSFDKFVEGHLIMPFLMRVGLTYNSFPVEFLQDKLVATADLEINPSTRYFFGLMLGAEYNYNDLLYPRIGYKLAGNIEGFDGLSMGFGVKYQWNTYLLNFDYGMMLRGIFGVDHRITLAVNF